MVPSFLLYVLAGAVVIAGGYYIYTELMVLRSALMRQEKINAASSNMIGAIATQMEKMMPAPPTKLDAAANQFSIQIKDLGGNLTTATVEPNMTIGFLKSRISAAKNIDVDKIKLIFAGKELDNAETLESLNIVHNSVIHLVLRMGTVGATSEIASASGSDLSPEMKRIAVASEAQPLSEQQQTAGSNQVVVNIPPVVSDTTVEPTNDSSDSDSDESDSDSEEEPVGVEPTIGVSNLMANITAATPEHHQSVVGLSEGDEHKGDTQISKQHHCSAIISKGSRMGHPCGRQARGNGFCQAHQSLARPSMVMNRDTEL